MAAHHRMRVRRAAPHPAERERDGTAQETSHDASLVSTTLRSGGRDDENAEPARERTAPVAESSPVDGEHSPLSPDIGNHRRQSRQSDSTRR